MKRLAFGLLLIVASCTANSRARSFGGTATINLPPRVKLVTATWKGEDIWYLTRPARPDEKPERLTLHEESSLGVLSGDVVFVEH